MSLLEGERREWVGVAEHVGGYSVCGPGCSDDRLLLFGIAR